MSTDNNNSDPFDFDFNSLEAEDSSENAASRSAETGGSFDLDNPFGDDLSAFSGEASVSADNPYLNNTESALDDPSGSDFAADGTADEFSDALDSDGGGEGGESEESEGVLPIAAEKGKKKGGLGGLFGGKKSKAPKGEQIKEKKAAPKKEAKGKKEKKPLGERVPRDLETILCIVLSVFLLASLLMVNIASLVTSGKSLMQTICFLGAFNVIGLAIAAVPILFYKFPKERTLPNVMLGIAVVAVFIGLQSAVIEFYRYNFILTP